MGVAFRSQADVLLDAMKSCIDEHGRLWNAFVSLDAKAQGTAAIAGVLLGTTLAFIPRATFTAVVALNRDVATFLARTVVTLLILAIGAAVMAMFVRATKAPYRADWSATAALELDALPEGEERDQFVRRHYRSEVERWRAMVTAIRPLLRRKSYVVLLGQSCLGLAAALISAFALLAVV